MHIGHRSFVAGCLYVACCLLPWLSAYAACPPCDGYFDPAFAGGAGRRTLPLGLDVGNVTRPIILRRTDGGLIVVGTCMHSDIGSYGDACIAALKADGTMDFDFGPQHLGTTKLSSLGLDSAVAHAATLTSDGRIVMLLQVNLFDHYVVLLSADGTQIAHQKQFTLDTSAGGQTWHASVLAVQHDGKILIAGDVVPWFHSFPQPSHIVVVRMTADLSDYDHGFGNDGRASVDFDSNADATNDNTNFQAMVLQSDGRILVAGALYDYGLAALASFDAGGNLDLSFGDNNSGRITSDFGVGMSAAKALQVDAKGRIIVGGETTTYAGNGYGSEMVINRLLANGAQDSDFGTFDPLDPAGPVVFGADRGGSNDDILHALVVQSDGKIVAVGSGKPADAGAGLDFEVMRLNGLDGQPDFDFGVEASSMGDLGCTTASADDTAWGVVMGSGIVIAGLCESTSTPEAHYGIARLKVDEIFPSSFDR